MAKPPREVPASARDANVEKSANALVFSSMDALNAAPEVIVPPAEAVAEPMGPPAALTVPAAFRAIEQQIAPAGGNFAEHWFYWPWFCTFYTLGFVYRSWSNCLPAQHSARAALGDALGLGH